MERELLLKSIRIVSATILLVFWSFVMMAEGTKEIMPTAGDTYYLLFNRSGGQSVPFGVYTPNTYVYQAGTTAADYRINIKICTAGERIKFGFKSNNTNTYYRIRRPSDGAIVVGPTLIPSAAAAGFIADYPTAVAGPSSAVGVVGGYNDISYTTTEAGDYYIEFNQGTVAQNGPTLYRNSQFTLQFFDITVTTAANVRLPGRIWSKAWQFGDGGVAFRGSFFVYADDGIVTRLNLNGATPYYFSISCNSTGVINTGNPTNDRKSIAGPSLYPQYKLFFNDPDINCYPTGTFGNVIGVPTVSGCGTSRCINLNVDRAGNIIVLLDLNGVAGFQAGTVDRQISVAAVVGMNCVPWDGLDGLGNPVTSGVTINIQIDYLNGLTHFPLYDGEANPNGWRVTLVRPAGPAPRLFWDDSNIIPSTYAAGTALDGISNLTGCNLATGCHRWNNRGSNTCPPCSETLNTWWYANIVTIPITYVNNNVTADANTTLPGKGFPFNNFSACGRLTPIQLNGSVVGPVGVTGLWTAPGGDGTFSSTTNMTGTYTPGPNDIIAGSVKIKLRSVGGTCPAELDSLLITLVPPPAVFAGVTKSACKNNNIVSLSDATQNATTGLAWTGGAGTFTPNNTSLNPTYTPTVAELNANTVLLTLTGTGNAVCSNSTSTVRINYTPIPTSNAGANNSVCANNNAIALAGTVSVGATPAWTSSSGCVACFTSPGTVNTTYNPSATDIANGTVTFTLTSSLAGCASVTSTKTTTITPAQTVNAGPNQSICKNKDTTTLAGVTDGTTFSWTSSSGCVTCFSNPSSLTSTYDASATDLTNNSVTLTLTATRPTCANVTSTMTISFTPSPVISAGNDIQYCEDNPTVQLAGTINAPFGGVWSLGPGTFFPNNTDPNATYTLTPGEINGISGLLFTSTNNGNCNPVQDLIGFSAVPKPTVTVGAPVNVCRNNPSVIVSGTVLAPYSGTPSWSTTTGGTFTGVSFNPGTGIATATYNLSALDLTNGSASIRLNATPIEPSCAVVSAVQSIVVTEPPTVNAGANQTGVCFAPGTVNLNGFSSTGSGTWTGGGGSFTNGTSLNAIYNSIAGERGGTVTLTLTTTNNGLCNAVNDQVDITFGPQYTATAGAAPTVCANNPSTAITGSTNTGTGQWSGGTGTFSPDANTINSTYTPSAAEITAGVANLILTTTGVGGCTPGTSNLSITINPTPVISINAGAATSPVCADNPAAALSVTLPGGLGVVWSGGAGTFSPNNTTTPATYNPTAAEILAGTVTITATTTGNTLCLAVNDQINVTIAPAPTINAGTDQVLCGNTASATLNGTVTGATGGTWTSSGSGSFANATASSTTYTPSAADKTTGLVTLTFTSTGNGLCNAVSDQMTITFTVVPTINAGPNITACSNTLPVNLNGSGSPAVWSGGTGTYNPSVNAMNAIYTPSAAEITAGTVTLTLTTNPSGACPQISDQVLITILPSPIATAAPDIVACGNLNSIAISGSVNAQATGGFWTTTGLGTIGNPASLNTTYTPAASEKPGTVTLTLTTTGNGSCAAHSDDLVITISEVVTVNAGPNQNLCNDGNAKALSGLVTGATGGTWSIIAGTGTLANATSLTLATYTPNPADVNVTIRLTTTGNPAGCAAISDDINITFSPEPIVTTGPNQTVCGDVASIALTGTVTGALGQVWTQTGGFGTFSLSNSTLNTNYVPPLNETGVITFTLTSTGNGVCNTEVYSSTTTVTITPKPTINAGPNVTVCQNNAATTLLGTATVATGGTWTTAGDGTFSAISGNGLGATYTPGPTDISNGTATLTLTSTGNGTCLPVSDVMVITITASPTVNGGPNRIVCANNKNVSLSGIVSIATGGTWTSLGSGAFSGTSANGLISTYTPSDNDTTAHAVRLVLTSTGNGLCLPVTDTVDVSITPAPIVRVGPDHTICADSFFLQLDAEYLHATAGIWTTSGLGTFFNSNATFDTAVYIPHPSERPGTVTLTFTTTVQGACAPVSDNLLLTITGAPTVTAGADQTMCSNGTSINILGTKNAISSGIIWTTSGNGTFGTNTSLGTTYTPSAIDKAAGTVILTITSTGNGTCKPVFDQLTLSIIPMPVVNMGLPFTVCADVYNVGIPINPTYSNTSSVSWATSGTGAFSPTNNTINPRYFPSVSDTIAGSVTLTVTANGNSPCAAVTGSVIITINPAPIVNAGTDMNLCNGSNASLSGSILNASGGIWTSSGTGTFAPDQNNLTASYIPSLADTTAGSVTLTLTSTGMGTCNTVSDQTTITFHNIPVAYAGINDSLCADAESYTLNGTVLNATGGTWSSSGTGGFFPNANSLSTMYFITPQDSINGQVVLTLTTTGNGPCAAVSSNISIDISPIPSADAGPATINVCTNATDINLNGSVVNATGGYWGTAGDGTFSDAGLLNTTYTFGPGDKLASTVLITLISQGNGRCHFYTDSIRVNFTPATTVDAGLDRTICRKDFPIALVGTGTTGIWSGGTAAQFSNINSLTSTYTPTPAESALGTLTLTLSAVSACAGPPSDVTFTFMDGDSVDVNPITTVCTNVNSISLAGSASTPGTWTSTGSGGFLNNNINTTYTFSAGDKTAGIVRFTYTIPAIGFCLSRRDTASVRINPTPTITAGPDQTRCANALTPVNMNGAFTIAGGVNWTTPNGTGIITNPNSTSATYTPTPADIALSPITLVIETTGNGFCSTQSDIILLTITAAPTALTGPDTTICADKVAQISVTRTVASGGLWTAVGGSGSFSPNTTANTVVYTPSSADTLAGSVTIRYQTTGNGICSAVTDDKLITFVDKPIVNAGADEMICSGQDSTILAASGIVNAAGILWTSTGTGRFSPNNTSINAYYVPSALDKANGGAIIQLTSTGTVECDPVQDFKSIVIIPSPVATVSAGFDQTMCEDQSSIQLAGMIMIATQGTWDCIACDTDDSGFAPDVHDLFAQFTPTITDKNNGSVTIRLTTTDGNGICAPVFDEMIVTIIDVPQVDAGPTQSVCADIPGIQLNGTITHATLLPAGYSWVASGSGIFTPNAFVANPVYIPSAADTTIGQVNFTLKSTNNGTCQEYTDDVLVTLLPQPVINAGIDKTTCANVASSIVIGTMLHSTGAIWTSSGTGIISPQSANGLTASYAPTPADNAAGSVILTITTDPAGIGTCNPVNDQMVLTILSAPIVNVGPTTTVCADNTSIPISGTVTSVTGAGGLWTTLGSGTFASNTSLTSAYRPSALDTLNHFVDLVLSSTNNGPCGIEDDTVRLVIDPKPIVSVGPVQICELVNGSALTGAVLNAGGGIWTSSGTGTFSLNASTLMATYFPSAADELAGNITLTLTSTANGTCNSVSNSTNLNITPMPIANAGPDQFICVNSNTSVNAQLDPVATRYEWSRFTGAVINANSISLNITADKDTAFILTVYDNKNCASVKDTVNIKTFIMPVLNINGTTCFTDSNVIKSTSIPSPVVPGTYQWFDNGSIMTGQNGTIINPTQTSVYSLTFSYGACTSTSNPFTINPSPSVAGIDKTNCVNNLTTLATSNVSGGSSFNYTWDPHPSIVTNLGSSIQVVYTNVFDTVSYRVTVTNEFPCSTVDSVYLISIAKPLLSIENDTLCQNEQITLVASASNYGTGGIPPIEDYFPSYVWTKDGVNLNNNTNSQLVTQEGEYIVEIILGDCNDNKDTSMVIYHPKLSTILEDKKFCAATDSIAVLDATATPKTGYTFTYLWSPTNETTPSIGAELEGDYIVTVTSTIGSTSCQNNDTANVISACPPRVFVPNVFTPGSETNKTFKVYGTNYTNFTITIFNRWGEVIFSSTDLEFMQNTGWDGTYKNKPMPQGVYPYIIYYDGESEEYLGPYKKDGDILILR